MPLTLQLPRAPRRTHPLRNALRLDPICQVWIAEAVHYRRRGLRATMRVNAHAAILRARTVWRTYVNRPLAA